MPARRPTVAVLAPVLDGTDISEPGVGFELMRAVHDTGRVRLIFLTLQRDGRVPTAKQLPGAEVISWPEPRWLLRRERLNAMAQVATVPLYWLARRWIKRSLAAGRRIDIVHQFLPRAPRYSSALPGLGIPYIIGPVGGALPTPDLYRGGEREPWFQRLRALDTLRFRYDPWLRRGFRDAAVVLGVAPYMRDVLSDVPMRRYESLLGIGVRDLPALPDRPRRPRQLRLLHVGRAVRTKGLREAVAAICLLQEFPDVTLTVAGNGPDLDEAKRRAAELGVADRIRFLGHRSRAEIEELYQTHDAFLFPSYRESMGAVLYEAMRWGLPAITVDYGGPGYIVDESCGLKVPLATSDALAASLATHIRNLAENEVLYTRLSEGARAKIAREALWSLRAERLLEIYTSVLRA